MVYWPRHPPIRAHPSLFDPFLGTVVALFFQCASVLLNPTRPIKKSVKWALVAHTVAMFSFLTTTIGIYLNDGSLLFINNREFPGDNETFPGPVGYEYYLDTKATTIVFEVMFPLNQWLADGLLVNANSNVVAAVFNVVRSSSSIVATSFIP
jgi:hypothetical protein